MRGTDINSVPRIRELCRFNRIGEQPEQQETFKVVEGPYHTTYVMQTEGWWL